MHRIVGALLESNVFEGYGKTPSDVDFDTPDAPMLARLTRDTWQFAAAKNYNQMRDLTLALVDENGKARTFPEFKAAAEAINAKYNKSWLLTEYNSAVGSATMASKWAEFKANEKDMPYLKYQTVGDDRVRNEHRALDGVVRKIDDSFWSTHYPPNGWGCRCDVIQLATSSAKETEHIPDVPINPMFRTNLAATGLVYPAGHPYYNGVPHGELRKALAYLPADATYKRFKVGNGVADVNLLHYDVSNQGIAQLKHHAEISANLIDLGFKNIKMLPSIHEKDAALKERFYPKGYKPVDAKKNPDFWMQSAKGKDMICDFKYMTGSGRNIARHIDNAAKQANYAVIKLSKDAKLNPERVAKSAMAKMDLYDSLHGVIVLNSDGDIFCEVYRKSNGR
ncbi:phage head morphogenesis protein [Acetobacteroides hydrogenigenes]|uniref:SPP1 gp7 family putative phage head morphogenesis protein n=1 Tax=Acetobacteroides hydrogenigenes TaxID=979970 RepID=A0A4R2EAG0_9BACT|nr:phage minor head protein [Acetobacteroides hydrogenigenes]TCN63692.1 SPP1 gp7 family putative phage head morphogenesis protein [Acetobacteroides hydrogenigenes]